MAYEINYNDRRFQQVEAQKQAALNNIDVTYGQMIGNSDKYYQDQIDATEQWGEKQSQLQQDKTDFAIEKIEQQKDQTHKDYIKEQSGAYVDWQKQSDQYGVNAEKMATSGMTKTGYSESSQVSMYNTYQYRVAAAREVYSRAVLEYDNAIKEAQLQNNSILAEIAYNTLQTKLKLGLEQFQYKNELIMAKTEARTAVENQYYSRWQDVLAQINQENALAEEVRQYNASLAEEQRQFNAQMAEEQRQFDAKNQQKTVYVTKGGGGGGGGSATVKGTGNSAGEALKNRETKQNLITKAKKINSYADAVKFMNQYGISGSGLSLLDSATWSKAKRIGEHGSELQYSSYAEYVQNYLVWAVGQS